MAASAATSTSLCDRTSARPGDDLVNVWQCPASVLGGPEMHLLTAAVLVAAGAALTPAVFPATHPQTPNLSDEIPSSCPVTKPSEYPFVPPPPYPSAARFSIGTAKLWTNITA